ncbi:hypothetical protein [Roseateles sp.]|uniref:hypothetical protein n=1 Tax=Roseateles sp. TaxID=1971397 RepID=UPI0032657651
MIAGTSVGLLMRHAGGEMQPPLPASPPHVELASVAELLALRPEAEWQLRWLHGKGAVLVIQFPNLWAQGRALNRAAALLEKGGARRDQVLTDAGLRAALAAADDNEASYFLGHDYRADDLARFFNLAQAQQVALNANELRLRQLLLDAGLLHAAAPGQFSGQPDRALISFSAEQADDPATPQDEGMDSQRRESVLRHELSHGRYFTDARYRDHCRHFWTRLLSETERQTWRRYLDQLGYDPADETLMVNETQALLMHTPDTRDFDAAALGIGASELEGLRARFRQGMPAGE